MDKALLVIDYTYDFVADEGKLTCGLRGQKIEERVKEITEDFYTNNQFLVFAVDVHVENDPYHPETNLFPPHNIMGSKGRELYGELDHMVKEKNILNGLNSNVKWMDKTRYSAFAGTSLDMDLKARGINELHLVGVCTDICILHTAVDAYNKGFNVYVHEDAVESFNPTGHEWALSHFQQTLGAKVVKDWKID